MTLSLILPALFLAASSVFWDFLSYGSRQSEWERAHPGQMYVPGYRRKMLAVTLGNHP